MKLVIDIDEKDYRMIQDRVINDEAWGLNLSDIDIAISEGKPLDSVLDEIRAEIEEYMSTIDYAISEDELKIKGLKEAYVDCLEIIDKYKAESEE